MRYAVIFVVIVAITASIVVYAKPSTITVIAEGDLQIYDKATSEPSARSVVAALKANSEAPVQSCIDLKHYLVPEVITADGKRGYVIDGPFRLRRDRVFPFFSRQPVVWGC